MLATLSKLALMDPNLPTGIMGKSISEVQSIEWVQRWSEVKQVFIADFNGDGILQLNEWFMRGDVVVLATPSSGTTVRNLWISVCWWYGCCHVNCRWSCVSDINALSHDIYKIIDLADTAKRLLVARVLLVIIGAAGAYIASSG